MVNVYTFEQYIWTAIDLVFFASRKKKKQVSEPTITQSGKKQLRLDDPKMQSNGGGPDYKDNEISSYDIDLLNQNLHLDDLLDRAFGLTGQPKESFIVSKTIEDESGNIQVVEYKGFRGAEVSLDAPHVTDGPTNYHIGVRPARGDKDHHRLHILIDYLPYYR